MHRIVSLAAATILTAASMGQTPAKPANATGQCKDGTYSTASGKSGACRGHNGVKDWYAEGAPTPAAKPAEPAASPTPAPAAAPQPTTNNQQPTTSATSRKGPKADLAAKPAAPGGAPNLVWVNTSSNVYHCYGSDFYGKTKAGSYMSEADAKAKGAHGNRGATCTK